MTRAKRGRQAKGLGSLFQRADNGLWVATLDLGRDGGTGRRIRRSFAAATQSGAIAKRNEFVRDLEDGLAPRTSRRPRAHTVGSWLDYWLERVIEAARAPKTYDGYESIVRLHIKPHLGAVPLAALSTDLVDEWMKTLAEKGVGTRTRQYALTRLRTALNVAVARQAQTGLRYNAAALSLMPPSTTSPVQPPNLHDARALLEAARGDRLEALVTVALAVGLRRGEALGLMWPDIDFEQRVIRVRRIVQRVATKGLIVREGIKGKPGTEWPLPVPQVSVHALLGHRARQVDEMRAAGTRWRGPVDLHGQPAGFVFCSSVGTVLDPRNAFRAYEAIRHRAGLDSTTFHQLRHDFASLLLAQGVPLYAVSQMLRHASPAITARYYAHLTPELHRVSIEVMDDVLGPLLEPPQLDTSRL